MPEGGLSRLSLQGRQLLAASLGLIAFLGLTGYALDRAFTETAESALRDRLKSYTYAYFGGMDFSRGKEIGRASCRERVCPYVWISVVAVSVTKQQIASN